MGADPDRPPGIGQLTPPAITGVTQEEREEQARNVAFVPIKPIVSLL